LVSSAAAFLALPIARRRAKVRWRHILRCAAIGSLSLLALVPAACWGLSGPQTSGRSWRQILEWICFVEPRFALTAAAIGVWLGLLWWPLCGRYLRMEKPLAVAASVAALGTGFGLTAGFLALVAG
jgi:hypothetical protein